MEALTGVTLRVCPACHHGEKRLDAGARALREYIARTAHKPSLAAAHWRLGRAGPLHDGAPPYDADAAGAPPPAR